MLGLTVLVLCVFTSINGGAIIDKPYYDINDEKICRDLFEDFIRTYNKTYPSKEEKDIRFVIFQRTLDQINQRNSVSNTSVHDITRFADLTENEFIKDYTGFKLPISRQRSEKLNFLNISLSGVPDSFDWRDKNVVTDVKDQGQCGSCWAFSAIANIESQYAKKYNKMAKFSEELLVSCDRDDGGCDGGDLLSAFGSLLRDMGGVELQEDYPYVSGYYAKAEECKFDQSKIKTVLANYRSFDFRKFTEDEIKALLYKNGPISIIIDASPLQTHTTGILQQCYFVHLNHAVLLVGYGEENGVPFWTVKNSWGKGAHEDGYFRMKRGVNCLSFKNSHAATSEIK